MIKCDVRLAQCGGQNCHGYVWPTPSRLQQLHKHSCCLFTFAGIGQSQLFLSDWEDNKMMCSISTPKSCRALTWNRLLFVRINESLAEERDAQQAWLITETRNTALVQPFRKSLSPGPASCSTMATWHYTSSPSLCCSTSACTWVRLQRACVTVCVEAFAVVWFLCSLNANLLRQQDQPCPEALGWGQKDLDNPESVWVEGCPPTWTGRPPHRTTVNTIMIVPLA